MWINKIITLFSQELHKFDSLYQNGMILEMKYKYLPKLTIKIIQKFEFPDWEIFFINLLIYNLRYYGGFFIDYTMP